MLTPNIIIVAILTYIGRSSSMATPLEKVDWVIKTVLLGFHYEK